MISPAFQIKAQKETQDSGEYIIEPLERGYGQTLGNALRRVLLSSLPGIAITEVKISGVRHKFSTLPGMKEDIIELILNIKKIRIKAEKPDKFKLKLEKTGPGEVLAGDIQTPGGVEIVNKDLVLADLADRKNKLKVEMVVEPGFGFSLAEERKSEHLGVIPVDASFSPVRRVNYRVEATRVGRQTNLDRLILEITTDGTIKAKDALKESARLLVAFFSQIYQPKKVDRQEEKASEVPDQTMKLTVEELELPTRIANALRKGGYGTVGDVVQAPNSDLVKVKNLGDKSIKVVHQALQKKGIKIG